MSQYADDTTLILANDYWITRAFNLINIFERRSGSRLNPKKTEGLWVGSQAGHTSGPGHPYSLTSHFFLFCVWLFLSGFFWDSLLRTSHLPVPCVSYFNFIVARLVLLSKFILQLNWYLLRALTLLERCLLLSFRSSKFSHIYCCLQRLVLLWPG